MRTLVLLIAASVAALVSELAGAMTAEEARAKTDGQIKGSGMIAEMAIIAEANCPGVSLGEEGRSFIDGAISMAKGSPYAAPLIEEGRAAMHNVYSIDHAEFCRVALDWIGPNGSAFAHVLKRK